jgi:hypothetical protein
LLDLNLVDVKHRERFFEVALDWYDTLSWVLLYDSDDVTKYFWKFDTSFVYGLLLEEHANMLHCLVSRTGISDNPFDRW